MTAISRRNVLQTATALTASALSGCGGGGGDTEGQGGGGGSGVPPVASFNAGTTSGLVPLTVAFSDTSTGEVASWLWTFGDGSTSSERNPSHVYTVAGSYSVSLLVTGPGGSHTTRRDALVQATVPVASRVSVSGPGSGALGLPSEQFTVGTDIPVASAVRVTPSDDGGGGTFSPTSVLLTAAAPTATFVYTAARPGTQRIVVSNDATLTNPGALNYAASVVAWPSSIARNTWGAIPASNRLADVNPDLDPSCNPNFGQGFSPWRPLGVSAGHFANITDWCGAAFDSTAANMWWVDAGGHNSMWDNNVIKLELNRDAPRYVRIRNPSGSIGKPVVNYPEFDPAIGNRAEYSDGRPRTHHTTNFSFYWPGLGPGLATEIVLCPSGGYEYGRLRPYIVSETDGERSFLGANKFNEPSGGWCSAVYDPLRDCIWKMPTAASVSFSRWGGPNRDSWVDIGGANYFNGSLSLCYLPGLDLILVGNGGDDAGLNQTVVGGWGIFDPKTGQLYARGITSTYPTFTGAPVIGPAGFACGLWPGLCQPQWAESLGAVLAWDMSAGSTTQVMRITPPSSGDPRTGTWTIDFLPVSGSNQVVPTAAVNSGTYGRFFVWDAARICGVVNDVNEAGYFFRYG